MLTPAQRRPPPLTTRCSRCWSVRSKCAMAPGFRFAPPAATAPAAAAVYGLTHVDVFPAGKDQAAVLVTALAEANRRLPGNLQFDVLQIVGHPNHFTLVQGWRDREAFDDSLMAASTRDFRAKLTPLEGALYDERLYHALR